MGWASTIGTLLMVGLTGSTGAGPTLAGCPDEAELLQLLAGIDRSSSSRVARFSTSIPASFYERAAEEPGRPAIFRDGKSGSGVVFAELPVEALWMAVNDEEHHDRASGYFPLQGSVIVAGTPRGASRIVFQYFQQWGIGRWWASQVTINAELFAETDGGLWETWWVNAGSDVSVDDPPIRDVARKFRAMRGSHGSWLLAPLSPSCTLIEFYNWSDPGGAVGVVQGLMAKKSIRSTVDGVMRLAAEHTCEPHADTPFIRPDGQPLDQP